MLINQVLDVAEAIAVENISITVDNKEIARIAGTRIKVAQIALEHTRLGRTPEQIVSSHPHLSRAQVGAALAFYDSHRETIEAQISAALDYSDKARQEETTSEIAAKLRAEKRQREQQAA